MSNTVQMILKSMFLPLSRQSMKLPNVLYSQSPKYLYAKGTLGLDAFQHHQQQVNKQMEGIEEKFREKMLTYTGEDSTMIFTEDLKNMVYLARNDEDMDLAVKMMNKFNSQNKTLRFGNFVFGPIVIRMFHLQNKPQLALECFNAPELEGFFDQLITYQILLDLLYENGMYSDMLKVYERIISRQIHETKYPRNVIVLTMAACYKMNSPESFKYAMDVWSRLSDAGHYPMRRAVTFIAGLALNQGQPEAALELVAAGSKQNYVTIRNIKVQALSAIGRIDDAIVLLKSAISDDQPGSVPQTFSRDVIEIVKNAVLKADNPDVSLEFNRLEKLFEKQGHISNLTLDEHLCSEIQMPAVMNNRQQNQFSRYDPTTDRQRTSRFDTGRQATGRYQSGTSRRIFQERPGLDDLV